MTADAMALRALGVACLAFIAVLVLTPLWMRVAHRIGAIDYPRGRHKHRKPTPTSGGAAIFLGVCVAVLPFLGWPVPDTAVGLLIAGALLVMLNIYDDIHGLPPAGRLAAQFALAIVAVEWGVRIDGVGNIFGLLGHEPWIDLGWMAGPITVIWIVLITNALNWLDGVDGLAAGIAAISAFALAVMGAFSTTTVAFTITTLFAAGLCGGCAGFLKYNFAPARVFMGDTGAMFLGYMLACLSVLGAFKGPTAATVILPLLVLGVPLFDSTTAIAKRILNGKNPLMGDRSHIHHRLLDRGLSVAHTALVIYGFAGVFCLLALWLWWK